MRLTFLQNSITSRTAVTPFVGKNVSLNRAFPPHSNRLLRQRETPAAARDSFYVPAIVDEVINRSGAPLDRETREFFEPRFGHDFSQVRVFADERAAESARSVNALAYTVGDNLVFGRGRYEPRTTQGRHLLAHELTHVIQQGYGSRDVGAPLQPAPADHDLESQADKKANDVIFGHAVGSGSFAESPVSLQRAFGQEIGTVSGCIGVTSEVTGPTFYFKVGCDDFLAGEKEKLEQLVDAVSPTDRLAVHGFASEEGSVELNMGLSCLRSKQAVAVLDAAGLSSQIEFVYEHGAVSGPLPERRSVVIEIYGQPQPRQITSEEQSLLDRLTKLSAIAKTEGTAGVEFHKVLDSFKQTLTSSIQSLSADEPLPHDVDLVMKALMLWSQDPGNKWGEGWWDSDPLVMSAAHYVTVPSGQYKCNAYVAETIYQSLRLVFLVHEAEQAKGQYFPYRAGEWGDVNLAIPKFSIVQTPKMGDVWSSGSHTGIFLGEYSGKKLYISARDDGEGVFGLDKVQKEHGVQIKYLPDGGVYRRYTP